MSKGERCDRRQWRKKGAERVAAVGKTPARLSGAGSAGHRNRVKSNNAAGIVTAMEPETT